VIPSGEVQKEKEVSVASTIPKEVAVVKESPSIVSSETPPPKPEVRSSPKDAVTDEQYEAVKQRIEEETGKPIREVLYQQTLPWYQQKANERGWNIQEDPNLPKAGEVTTDPKDNTIKIGQEGLRGAGTPWHEGWHKYFVQLLNSGSDRAIVVVFIPTLRSSRD